MLTQHVSINKLTTIALLLLVAAEVLWGCPPTGPFPVHSDYPLPFSTVSLAQHGLSVAVWLEDQCESRETDEQHVTLLEIFHDGLALPTEYLVAISVVTAMGTIWSLYDRITLPTGLPLPNRPKIVWEYVKPHRAGPKFDIRRPRLDVPVIWLGCLAAYADG